MCHMSLRCGVCPTYLIYSFKVALGLTLGFFRVCLLNVWCYLRLLRRLGCIQRCFRAYIGLFMIDLGGWLTVGFVEGLFKMGLLFGSFTKRFLFA